MYTIAFEGHNGVGKTTIAKALSKRLNAKYMYGVDEEVLKNGLKEKFIKDAYWLASALYWSYVNILDTKSQTFLCCTSS